MNGGPAAQELVGMRVRRVDLPLQDLLALTVSSPERRGVLLLGFGKAARGVGFVDERPRGAAAGAVAQGLRRALEGGRIAEVDDRGSVLRLSLERGAGRVTLELWMAGPGNAVLLDADGEVVQALHRPEGRPTPAERARWLECDLPELARRGETLLDRHRQQALQRKRTELSRAVRTTRRRLQRRLDAVQGDLERALQAPALRHRAGLLLSHLHAIPKDARAVTVPDHAADPLAEVQIELGAGLDARTQAEAWFRRARKLERGENLARQRLQQTREELDQIEALQSEVEAAPDAAALDALRERAREQHVALPRQPAAVAGRKQGPPARLPYREFSGSGGRTILVGRGPADNDTLTLHHARPHDLWLHVRDHAGAHVVIPLDKREVCPPDLLVDAATLAAHFSQAKGEDRVDVSYTQRRHVRKPRKAPPGRVLLGKEKVLHLVLEPARLQRLLRDEPRRAP
ncbi:MAG: NFACT RNA binding domain-containing protein [Myxococcales bacterium]